MNVIIDIGNTRTKFYLFDKKNELVTKEAFLNKSIDAIKKTLNQLAHHKIIVSASGEIPNFFEAHSFLKLTNKTPIPISVNYKTPQTLGTDRLALAVGAYTLFPNKNSLIIGTGTCITTNFIDQKGNYQGGSIAPGLTLRLQSLHTYTHKLPLIKRTDGVSHFCLTGKTTQENIESGVFNGAFAEIDGIIDRYKQIYKELTVILTGGDQEIFAKNLKNSIFAHAYIQAIGLNRILNYNE